MKTDSMSIITLFKVNIFSRGKESDKDILIYDVSYKILIRPKPFTIMLNKVDGFIRVYEFLKNTMLFTI